MGAAAVPLALSLHARFRRKNLRDIRDFDPRDMIDRPSFLWVQGSDEYPNEHEPTAQRIDPTRVLHFGANKDVENEVHRHRTEFFCAAKCSGKFLKNY
jgi:hypothetical protein